VTPDAGTARAGPALRPVTAADRPFLLELYASTRADELAAVPWDEPTRTAFLAGQLALREAAYARDAPHTDRSVVLVDDQPAGRLDVDRRRDEIRVVDLALLPGVRGQGLGGRLLAALVTESEQRGVPLTLHVERHNPARRLYARLGFVVAEDLGVHLRLTRPVPARAGRPARR
jgi:GNAT superfamily N-acetyltransferase